jgi:hypothetical protein
MSETLRTVSVVYKEPLAHIRISVPAMDHALIEAMDVKQGFARYKLEITRLIETHVFMSRGDLIEVKGAS